MPSPVPASIPTIQTTNSTVPSAVTTGTDVDSIIARDAAAGNDAAKAAQDAIAKAKADWEKANAAGDAAGKAAAHEAAQQARLNYTGATATADGTGVGEIVERPKYEETLVNSYSALSTEQAKELVGDERLYYSASKGNDAAVLAVNEMFTAQEYARVANESGNVAGVNTAHMIVDSVRGQFGYVADTGGTVVTGYTDPTAYNNLVTNVENVGVHTDGYKTYTEQEITATYNGEETDICAENHAPVRARRIQRSHTERIAPVDEATENVEKDKRTESHAEADVRRQHVCQSDDGEKHTDPHQRTVAATFHKRRERLTQRTEVKNARDGNQLIRIIQADVVVQVYDEHEDQRNPEGAIVEDWIRPPFRVRHDGLGDLHDRIWQMFVRRPLSVEDGRQSCQRNPHDDKQRNPVLQRLAPGRPWNI